MVYSYVCVQLETWGKVVLQEHVQLKGSAGLPLIVNAHTHTLIHMHVHTHIYTCTHTYMHACTHIHTQTQVFNEYYIFVCIQL